MDILSSVKRITFKNITPHGHRVPRSPPAFVEKFRFEGCRVYETCIRNAKLDAMRNSESPNAVLNHPNHGLPPIPLAVPFALLLDNNGRETLGVLDVHGLHVAVELLLGALLVVTSPGDADAHSVWDTLNTLLPDLLVQLGVDADIGGALD